MGKVAASSLNARKERNFFRVREKNSVIRAANLNELNGFKATLILFIFVSRVHTSLNPIRYRA